MFIRVADVSFTENSRKPLISCGVTRKSMKNYDDVIPGGIKLSPCLVSKRGIFEAKTGFRDERFFHLADMNSLVHLQVVFLKFFLIRRDVKGIKIKSHPIDLGCF